MHTAASLFRGKGQKLGKAEMDLRGLQLSLGDLSWDGTDGVTYLCWFDLRVHKRVCCARDMGIATRPAQRCVNGHTGQKWSPGALAC